MKSLYLRIYLTVLTVLLLFAAVSGWVFQRHLDQERVRVEGLVGDRMVAWAELLQRSLPGADAPADEQATAVREWSQRLRLPIALDDGQGARIVATESFVRRQEEEGARIASGRRGGGRALWRVRPRLRLPPRPGEPPDARGGPPGPQPGDM